MIENICGREKEKQQLSAILHSDKAEFVAVCGRRRVGKTFLIKEFFEDQLVFKTAGLADAPMSMQIKTIYKEMMVTGLSEIKHETPKDWTDVFFLLRLLLSSMPKQRKVVLLDELPWMDTPRSGFVSALEYFWNSWASEQRDLVFVVCGSATSWMMDKLINSHGGLHNRLTHSLFVEPFSLAETEQMLINKGLSVSRYDIALLYMSLGGVPYYIDMLSPQLSIAQNINELCFSSKGSLLYEFDNLYAALFKNSSQYVHVVRLLSTRSYGLTRDEISNGCNISTGGGLTMILNNLVYCGFVRCYHNYGGKRGETELYQLVDFFTLFYFRFMEKKQFNSWMSLQEKPVFYSWCGLTFELLMLSHIDCVKRALGISGIETKEYAWRCRENNDVAGAQIDLIIDRADNTINLCEAKFSISEFEITKDVERDLLKKKTSFLANIPRRKSIQLTMLTTFGVAHGSHSSVISNEISLDDLFR